MNFKHRFLCSIFIAELATIFDIGQEAFEEPKEALEHEDILVKVEENYYYYLIFIYVLFSLSNHCFE